MGFHLVNDHDVWTAYFVDQLPDLAPYVGVSVNGLGRTSSACLEGSENSLAVCLVLVGAHSSKFQIY